MHQPDNSSMVTTNNILINLPNTVESERPILGIFSPESTKALKYEYLEDQRERLSSHSMTQDNSNKHNLQVLTRDFDTALNKYELNLPYSNWSIHPNLKKVNYQEADQQNSLALRLGEKSQSSEVPSDESKIDEVKSLMWSRNRPRALSKKSEEIRRANSFDQTCSKNEPVNAEGGSNKEDTGNSFLSDIVISRKRGDDELKKSGFVKRNLLPSKNVTISLPFDAFVDQVKGHQTTSIASNYPSYKIDKRLMYHLLLFLGKEVDYPWHIISYHSTFRRLWNLFITLIITYQIFWYPIAVTFIYGNPWPTGSLIFEIMSIFIFFLDIIINIRTTYSNENNEEIIDGKMMSKNYLKTKLFLIDVITTLPVAEVLLLILIDWSNKWTVYSLLILIRMLRCFKIPNYLLHRTFSVPLKLLRIFVTFFIVVHWVSCIWYVIIKLEFPDPPMIQNLWFPNNLRMIATGDDELLHFYYGMDTIKVYGFTLLSVFMLVVGSDMAPITDLQIWMSVLIGLFGAVSLAYIFGLVTLVINRANEENLLYQQQLEELKHKLRINKIPHNLRVKVMEYFYYSWRKHSVLKKVDDFSELSIPLQRDIALYQHQEMILKVPLFKELDPVEILSIVQKLKTSIYMPGDKIIREGERGTEMFFIQEGKVEKLIKTALFKNRQESPNFKQNYERILLEKGSYFGEVALMSNSKRTFDVNAFEFCILYSFSRSDYENLKTEFRDIGPRLRSGLKHYKNTHMGQLIHILRNLDIFQNFTEPEVDLLRKKILKFIKLRRICDEYLEEMFVDPDKVVLAPKNRINAIYVIFGGNVCCYGNDEETKNYVNHLRRSDNKDNWTIVDVDEQEDIDCLDDDILNLEKDKISMDDQKKRLNLIKTYSYGEYFGTLDVEVNEIKCNNYFLTDSGCQIGAITQSLKSQMMNEDPLLYEKLKGNIIKCCPRRVMMPIEEESDSSFTTKNNTIVKARRTSLLSDIGKKPILIKGTSINHHREDEIEGVKAELQQLEDEMNHFKSLISNVNMKLGSMFMGVHPSIKSPEQSPLKPKSKLKVTLHSINQYKGAEKNVQSKDLPNTLLGVDEEDQAEESQTIKKDD